MMGRLRACCRLHRLLAPPPLCHPLAHGSHCAAAHGSRFSRRLLSSAAAAVAPHDAWYGVLGGSSYYAWIRAAAEAAPAPAPPQEEEDDDEGLARYIPVKAYFLSTRKTVGGLKLMDLPRIEALQVPGFEDEVFGDDPEDPDYEAEPNNDLEEEEGYEFDFNAEFDE